MEVETRADDEEAKRREIEEFESRIDLLHLNLDLLRYPKNLAIWSLVTNGLERLYEKQPPNPERERTMQTSLSRSFGVFIRKVEGYPFRGKTAVRRLGLNPHLRQAAVQANEYARFWFVATGYFPEWHQGEVTASLIGPNGIRFDLASSKAERELSAYQKI